MPLFIFISGYFSKNFTRSSRKNIKTLLIPYFVLNTLYYLYHYIFLGLNKINFLIPGWTLWYLLSLYFWRTFCKYIYRVNNKTFLFCISIVFGILINFIPYNNNVLSISRTLSFFPYFLLGFYFKKSNLEYIRSFSQKSSLIVLFILFSSVLLYFYIFNIDYKILYLTGSFTNYKLSYSFGVLTRLLLYFISIFTIMVFLNLTQSFKLNLTNLGRKSMHYYSLHIYVIYFLQALNIHSFSSLFGLFINFIFSILITSFIVNSFILIKSTIKSNILQNNHY